MVSTLPLIKWFHFSKNNVLKLFINRISCFDIKWQSQIYSRFPKIQFLKVVLIHFNLQKQWRTISKIAYMNIHYIRHNNTELKHAKTYRENLQSNEHLWVNLKICINFKKNVQMKKIIKSAIKMSKYCQWFFPEVSVARLDFISYVNFM